MRRAAKCDANQAAVIDALRRAGASAWSTPIGNGFPDVIAATMRSLRGGRTVLFEVKDGTLPPSKRKLRTKQEEFAASWQGECYLVESPHAAVRIMFGKQRADSICPEGDNP